MKNFILLLLILIFSLTQGQTVVEKDSLYAQITKVAKDWLVESTDNGFRLTFLKPDNIASGVNTLYDEDPYPIPSDTLVVDIVLSELWSFNKIDSIKKRNDSLLKKFGKYLNSQRLTPIEIKDYRYWIPHLENNSRVAKQLPYQFELLPFVSRKYKFSIFIKTNINSYWTSPQYYNNEYNRTLKSIAIDIFKIENFHNFFEGNDGFEYIPFPKSYYSSRNKIIILKLNGDFYVGKRKRILSDTLLYEFSGKWSFKDHILELNLKNVLETSNRRKKLFKKMNENEKIIHYIVGINGILKLLNWNKLLKIKEFKWC
jgi:hypothetical protein